MVQSDEGSVNWPHTSCLVECAICHSSTDVMMMGITWACLPRLIAVLLHEHL